MKTNSLLGKHFIFDGQFDRFSFFFFTDLLSKLGVHESSNTVALHQQEHLNKEKYHISNDYQTLKYIQKNMIDKDNSQIPFPFYGIYFCVKRSILKQLKCALLPFVCERE